MHARTMKSRFTMPPRRQESPEQLCHPVWTVVGWCSPSGVKLTTDLSFTERWESKPFHSSTCAEAERRSPKIASVCSLQLAADQIVVEQTTKLILPSSRFFKVVQSSKFLGLCSGSNHKWLEPVANKSTEACACSFSLIASSTFRMSNCSSSEKWKSFTCTSTVSLKLSLYWTNAPLCLSAHPRELRKTAERCCEARYSSKISKVGTCQNMSKLFKTLRRA